MHGDRADRGVGAQLRRNAARRVPLRVAYRLPQVITVRILSWRSEGRKDITDREPIALPGPLSLEVYWLRDGRSEGPAASVWVGSLELMRIDGLVGDAHVHYDLAWSRARRRADVAAQRDVDVDGLPAWLANELRSNLRYALSLRRSSRLRRLDPDQGALDAAADQVESWAEAALDRRLRSAAR